MSAQTIDGCRFDPELPVWRVRTPTARLLFDFELPHISPGMRDDLRRALRRLLVQTRPEMVLKVLSGFRVLAKHAATRKGKAVEVICIGDFEAYRRSLDGSEHHLAASTLECLKALDSAAFGHLSQDLKQELSSIYVAVPARSSPARMACPRSGALSRNELAVALAALRRAWAASDISAFNYALCMLALAVACRPGQAALLKVGDLIVSSAGGFSMDVTMPLIKLRRRAGPAPRARARRLHEDVATALAVQRTAAIAWGKARGVAAAECPLFFEAPRGPRRTDWPQLPWMIGHSSGAAIGGRIVRTFSALDLSAMRARHDERTITATRLRRSIATDARSAGRTFEQIGQLLWQTGSTAAAIYTGPSVGLIERVEKAVDFKPLSDLYRRELEAAGSWSFGR